jgi:hypothetical protein
VAAVVRPGGSRDGQGELNVYMTSSCMPVIGWNCCSCMFEDERLLRQWYDKEAKVSWNLAFCVHLRVDVCRPACRVGIQFHLMRLVPPPGA